MDLISDGIYNHEPIDKLLFIQRIIPCLPIL